MYHLESWDWGLLAARIASISTALLAIGAFLNRKGFATMIANRVVLSERVIQLQNENIFLLQQLRGARQDFDFASRAGAFTRTEAAELVGRVAALESVSAQNKILLDSALSYIRSLLAHIISLEKVMGSNDRQMRPIPPAPPAIATLLEEPEEEDDAPH
jgi:hypothetical protein